MTGKVLFPPFAGDDARRLDVIRLGYSGLDYIDVRGDGRTLTVAFFGPLPADLHRGHFTVEGGERITGIRVVDVRIMSDEPEAEGVIALRLDRIGDPSTYTLRVVGVPGVDPLYSSLEFTFDSAGERLTDCEESPAASAAAVPGPHIDYLAKDYATFRRLLLDRAALVMPDWNEGHIPDLNVTLLELLAYTGDQLSYFQDAVATEAYLATARKRVSVGRHARLLDYRMHEGCNARAWISLSSATDSGPIDPREITFYTDPTASAPAVVFEPIGNAELHVYAAHGPMQLYAWGNRTCSLAIGATAATLLDKWETPEGATEPVRALRRLEAGAFILFECVSVFSDAKLIVLADPQQRHVVRLTHVRREIDPLYDTPILEIAWAPADRLPFELPIAAPDPTDPSAPQLALSAAWGNLVAVDHGASLPAREKLEPVSSDVQGQYHLGEPNLTFADKHRAGSVASLDVRDPRDARPQIFEVVTIDGKKHERRWSAVPDLLASAPSDARYVVEVDENETAMLRFGDGTFGRRLPSDPELHVYARYRFGNGAAGNVGAETIVNTSFRGKASGTTGIAARNPLPARGGTEPESVDDVRVLAPSALREETARAIAPEDYARIAERDPRLQRAAAEFHWTGSRTIVHVALDPLASEDVDPEVIADVAKALEAVRRIGHDIDVVPPTYVPLYVELDVKVKSGYQRGHVLAALETTFGNGVLPSGKPGFFNPDELSFGGNIAQSRLIARALGVAGVQDVSVKRLERLDAPSPSDVPAVLTAGPLEIMRLDNDPALPQRGRLKLSVRGGQ